MGAERVGDLRSSPAAADADTDGDEAPSRRRGRRIVLFVILLVPFVLGLLWFVSAGRLLISLDEPARADVVVVPSGDVLGNRLVAAARTLLATGSPRLVVFTQGEGPLYSGEKVAQDFLDAEGVDAKVARLLPPGGSTSEEAGTFAALAHRCGWRSVIVVTSPSHSRRAGWLFGRALGFPSIVRVVSNGESFDADTWWTDDGATEVVIQEWTKILASAKYLIGRPRGDDPGVPC